MKVLVTGGAGFIGSHIVEQLIRTGNEVVIMDNLSSGKIENINNAARFYNVDICDPCIEDIFREESFDIVNHHAAQIDVRYSVANPQKDAEINIMGIINILQNSQRFGVKGIVFPSSGGVVYGEQSLLPIPETFSKKPFSPYGVSKLSSELYLYYYSNVMNMPYVVLRYGNVYGPRQDPHGEAGVVAIFSEMLLNNQTPTIYGDGSAVRDYIYIDDVVRANLLFMETLYKEENQFKNCPIDIDDNAFNIGTGIGTSVNELYHALRKYINYSGEVNYGPSRVGELNKTFLNINKVKKFEWTPATALYEGLCITVDSLR